MFELEIIFKLLQQTCMYLVGAYALSKIPFFIPVLRAKPSDNFYRRILCFLFFTLFCILSSYLGVKVNNSLANIRTTWALLSGLIGGPWVGGLVGLISGSQRYFLGGEIAESCIFITILSGFVGGFVRHYCIKKGRIDLIYNPLVGGGLAFCLVVAEMLLILITSKFSPSVVLIVSYIALPMLIANTLGTTMFISILVDRKALVEKYTSAFSAKALKIATSIDGLLQKGFNKENSLKIAEVIYQELDIGAVAITDREKILAFVGLGSDHHHANELISSQIILQAIEDNEVKYIDGINPAYHCSINKNCQLGSILVIPLHGENQQVLGTINLFEAKNTLLTSINHTFGRGIASLLSAQLLAGQNQYYKQLISQTEIKLLHAQVNPHFLFNTLNTLLAVIRRDQQQASKFVQNLSTFFRKNLKRSHEIVTLKDELDHITAYLEIEKMRFLDKLNIVIDVPQHFEGAYLPAFSLQPIVENAIKHGISQIIGKGEILIKAYQKDDELILMVEDNAGSYQESNKDTNGLGVNLVHKRIQIRYGDKFGMKIECKPDVYTRAILSLPLEKG
ncbi:sensor histidine kinase [Orbaceae bacterium ac157xtp]